MIHDVRFSDLINEWYPGQFPPDVTTSWQVRTCCHRTSGASDRLRLIVFDKVRIDLKGSEPLS
jgi:hypothetical protein